MFKKEYPMAYYDIKAKREEVDLSIGNLLVYFTQEVRNTKPDKATEITYKYIKKLKSRLNSLGVRLIDEEAELPDGISKYFPKMGRRFQDEMTEEGYVKAFPLDEIGWEMP